MSIQFMKDLPYERGAQNTYFNTFIPFLVRIWGPVRWFSG